MRWIRNYEAEWEIFVVTEKILEVKNLEFSFDTYAGEVHAIRGVSFHINQSESLAIVGESGCGKSVTVQSIMKLAPTPPGRLKGGRIVYRGRDITNYGDRQMEKLRGKEMSMIFQDPMTSLNPTMRIGRQISEGIKKHEKISPDEARKRSVKLLREVGISDPEKNITRYPHMYSGGMRQRVMIAIALACNPKILFADEPTTSLDVTTQAQILELMNHLKREFDMAIVLITHNLGIVARFAERISVMYAGKIVETGKTQDIFYDPRHPYTWGLLNSVPAVGKKRTEQLPTIKGTPPDLFMPPKGCGFYDRCEYRMKVCKENDPPSTEIEGGHFASCWLLDQRAPSIEPYFVKRHSKENFGKDVI